LHFIEKSNNKGVDRLEVYANSKLKTYDCKKENILRKSKKKLKMWKAARSAPQVTPVTMAELPPIILTTHYAIMRLDSKNEENNRIEIAKSLA